MAKGTLTGPGGLKTVKKGGSVAASSKKAAIVGSAATEAPAAKKAKRTPTRKKAATSDASDNDQDVLVTDSKGNQRRKLRPNDPKYRKHYKEVMAEGLQGLPLMHGENEDKIESILKQFDLNIEYGPAIGMTRLQRWKRAESWGLEPPAEVYDILTTIEGEDNRKYRECLFDGII